MSYTVKRLREMAAAARIGEVTPPADLFDQAANEIESERRLREQLADALARATGRLETRVAAAEGAMQEMIEVGRKADAEIERLRAALEEAIKSARVGDAPHVIVIAQRALKE